jgi:hypothetical protein
MSRRRSDNWRNHVELAQAENLRLRRESLDLAILRGRGYFLCRAHGLHRVRSVRSGKIVLACGCKRSERPPAPLSQHGPAILKKVYVPKFLM